MSTDTGIGAVKLPNDPERRGAIEELVAAIALAARRREHVTAAQASIAQADAEVQRTHARCVELGLIPGTRRANGRARIMRQHGENSLRARATAAVAAGHNTSATVAEHLGVTATSAASALLDAVSRGDLSRAKDENGRWRYSQIGGEQ